MSVKKRCGTISKTRLSDFRTHYGTIHVKLKKKLGIADISDLQERLNVVNARIEELNCYIRALFESKVKG